MKILVLDDQETRLIIFRQRLIGNIVECVKTATDAIKKLSEESWDMVFLDHDLRDKVFEKPGPGTGYEVAVWLRDHEDKKPKQIIIHSYNTKGAMYMKAILPGSIYRPGIWLTLPFIENQEKA